MKLKEFLGRHLPKLLVDGLKSVERRIFLSRYEVIPKNLLSYSTDLLWTAHNSDFIKNPKFIEAYHLGLATDTHRTLVGDDVFWRVHVLCWAASHAKKIPGDFVECGVNTGVYSRAIIHYADLNKSMKTVFLLDTFAGLSEKYSSAYEMARDKKIEYKGQRNLLDEVRRTFQPFPNVKIIPGPVPETLPQVTCERVAYLAVDMNCVQPEIAAVEYFWERMTPGGLIILDDYGYPGCIEQKRAHDDLAKKLGYEILSLPTCQGLIIKSC